MLECNDGRFLPTVRADHVFVQSSPMGEEVCAKNSFKKGECVFCIAHLPPIKTNNKYAITKDLTTFWDTVGTPVALLNHHCDPNLVIDFDTWTIFASRDIDFGEQLNFNYLQSEYDMAAPFNCLCNSANCFGKIAGYKHLNSVHKQHLKNIINTAPYYPD